MEEKIKYIITDMDETIYFANSPEEMGEIRKKVLNMGYGFKIFKVKLIENLDEK